MAPDDAADLINDLDQDRRLAVLEALPARQQAKVRRLLSYNPETGGGLMNPDFLSLAATTTAGEALEAIRRSDIAPEALAMVYTADPEGRIAGTGCSRPLPGPSSPRSPSATP
jgi:magnesium transporter